MLENILAVYICYILAILISTTGTHVVSTLVLTLRCFRKLFHVLFDDAEDWVRLELHGATSITLHILRSFLVGVSLSHCIAVFLRRARVLNDSCLLLTARTCILHRVQEHSCLLLGRHGTVQVH